MNDEIKDEMDLDMELQKMRNLVQKAAVHQSALKASLSVTERNIRQWNTVQNKVSLNVDEQGIMIRVYLYKTNLNI